MIAGCVWLWIKWRRLGRKSSVWWRVGRGIGEAKRWHRKALEIDEKLGRLEGMAGEYGNLGAIHAQRGDLAGARELWTKARDLFARIGMPHWVTKVQGWIDMVPAPAEPRNEGHPLF
jgi:hypothetical protein